MKKIIIAAISTLFLCSCSSQKVWSYDPNNYNLTPIKDKKSVAVLPFADKRSNENSHKLLMYCIPLMPYGWVDYNMPEKRDVHLITGPWTNYRPAEDYSKALAEELKAARIFGESYFDFKKGTSDFIIQGEILSTKYEAAIYSYGLSLAGPLLWFVGFPMGSSSNELSIRLTCLNTQTDGEVFSKRYTAPLYKKISWLFWPKNEFNYPEMLKEIYKEFIRDLRFSLGKINPNESSKDDKRKRR